MLTKGHSGASQESMRVASALLSWGIYGATMDWQQNCKLGAEAYIELAMPYLSRGIDSLYEKESSTV
ncbi:hypothetical protein [Paenibacillus albus]|uniref:hypothetical protein n=1 Tax=Paenibacillus albus TaxID=2495582 RepID=UPI001D13246E|nr:hypothetical protein [Paenibacillus albus]